MAIILLDSTACLRTKMPGLSVTGKAAYSHPVHSSRTLRLVCLRAADPADPTGKEGEGG